VWKEGIVVDGVEGNCAALRAEVKVAALQSSFGATKSVAGNGTKSHELGNEFRLRGVEVFHTEEFRAFGADIVDFYL